MSSNPHLLPIDEDRVEGLVEHLKAFLCNLMGHQQVIFIAINQQYSNYQRIGFEEVQIHNNQLKSK